jgi:hypothetical protein
MAGSVEVKVLVYERSLRASIAYIGVVAAGLSYVTQA